MSKYKEGILLNKYGALDFSELKELFDRLEQIEERINTLYRELGYVSRFEWSENSSDKPYSFNEELKKLKILTNSDDYEFVTETKLINTKSKKE